MVKIKERTAIFFTRDLTDKVIKIADTKDPDYILSMMKKLKKLSLEDKVFLIRTIKTSDAIKVFLSGEGKSVDSDTKLELLEYVKDSGYIVSILSELHDLSIGKKIKFLMKLEDRDAIKAFLESEGKKIEPNAKLSLLEFLGAGYITEVLKGERNIPGGIEQLIFSREGLESKAIKEAIKGVPEYVKSILEDKEELGKEPELILKLEILDTLGDSTYSKQIFESGRLGFENGNAEFLTNVLTKLGVAGFSNIEEELFSQKALDFLGEEQVYELIKYYKVSGKYVGIDRILENKEQFEQYVKFRSNVFEKKQIDIMNLADAISEFNGNTELILECMGQDLSEEEKAKFIAVLKEKKVVIETREELDSFSQIRLQTLSTMSERNQITYMLTGMTAYEYNEKLSQYLAPQQLGTVIADFGNEDPRFEKVKAVTETIELILRLKPEKRKEVIKDIMLDLSKEFTPEGSEIADARKAFRDIEIQIRKLYGKELSDALSKSKLPEGEMIRESELLEQYGSVEEKEGEKKEGEENSNIRLVKLDGQDFKLLIHGIDAFGGGTGRFEQRELGVTYVCTSLISEKNLARAQAACYYGFANVGVDDLVLEGPNDIYSSSGEINSFDVTSKREANFMKSEQLVNVSRLNNSYNEVVIWRKSVRPSSIVCFSSKGISEHDIAEAKRLSEEYGVEIPIVLIDEEKYKDKKVDRTEEHVEVDNHDKAEEHVEVANHDNTEEHVEVDNHDKAEGHATAKVFGKTTYIETIKKLVKAVPALAQAGAFRAIVEEMNKDKSKDAEIEH